MRILYLLTESRRRHVFRALAWYGGAAFALLQGLAFVAPQFGWPAWTVRAFIVAAFAGLPVVVLLSWAFDLTDKGLVRPSPVEARTSDATPPWLAPSPWLALVAGLALVIAAFNAWQLRTAKSDDERVRIAVMPFANLTGRAEDQELVDGLYDAFLDELGTNPNLVVPTRATMTWAAATIVDPRKIAAELKPDYLMEASVRRDGDVIELSVRLSEESTQRLSFHETFRGALDDALQTQRHLADRVAEVLWVAATPPALRTTPQRADPRAVEKYLEARSLRANRLISIRREADVRTNLEQAVAIDPAFAPGWAFLARYHAQHAANFFRYDAYTEHMPLARAALARALALDPNLLEAVLAEGWVAQADGDRQGQLEATQRAHAFNPSDSSALGLLGEALQNVGRWDESIDVLREQQRVDPFGADPYADLGLAFVALRRFDDAREAFREVARIDPARAKRGERLIKECETGDVVQDMSRGEIEQDDWALMFLGDFKRALVLTRANVERNLSRPKVTWQEDALQQWGHGVALVANGEREEGARLWEPLIAEMVAAGDSGTAPVRRPYYYMGLGQSLGFAGRPEAEIRAAFDKALALIPADDHSHLAEHTRRQVAMSYAFFLHDGTKAVEVLRESLQHPIWDGENGCAWKVWRYPLTWPIRDYPPFRELMTQHGVDVNKGVYDYGPAPAGGTTR